MIRSIHTTFAVLAAAAVMFLFGAARAAAEFPAPPKDTPGDDEGVQTAVLAGGCFWGMEGVFERLKGVWTSPRAIRAGRRTPPNTRWWARATRARGVHPGPL